MLVKACLAVLIQSFLLLLCHFSFRVLFIFKCYFLDEVLRIKAVFSISSDILLITVALYTLLCVYCMFPVDGSKVFWKSTAVISQKLALTRLTENASLSVPWPPDFCVQDSNAFAYFYCIFMLPILVFSASLMYLFRHYSSFKSDTCPLV